MLTVSYEPWSKLLIRALYGDFIGSFLCGATMTWACWGTPCNTVLVDALDYFGSHVSICHVVSTAQDLMTLARIDGPCFVVRIPYWDASRFWALYDTIRHKS